MAPDSHSASNALQNVGAPRERSSNGNLGGSPPTGRSRQRDCEHHSGSNAARSKDEFFCRCGRAGSAWPPQREELAIQLSCQTYMPSVLALAITRPCPLLRALWMVYVDMDKSK